MTEKDMLEKIRQSAKQVKAPDGLSPEKILEKCRNLEQEMSGKEKPERKKFRIRNQKFIGGLSAAAVFIICCISLKGIGEMNRTSDSGAAMDMAAQSLTAITEGAPESAPQEAETGAGTAESVPQIERKDAGKLYTLAKSYDDVYERLKKIQQDLDNSVKSMNGGMEDGTAITESADIAMAEVEELRESATNQAQKKQDFQVAEDAEGYSKTNVQTFGIDESDIVKTDGEYIYLLRGSSVSIVRTGKDKMEQVGELEADTESASADVCAMYVDGNVLVLLTQESRTALKQEKKEEEALYDAIYDMKYMDSDVVTSALTYDISKKESPVLLGKIMQDGAYVTSRKKGNILYLFTDKYLLDDYQNEPDNVIPKVNERKVAEDCIYMGDRGERALVISSLSVNKPETVRDSVMILDSGSEIYMGEDSLYLYRENYQHVSTVTEIAKFSMVGDYFNGEAATSVRGAVRDTFAIHEKDNKLRVLTTDTSGSDTENCLFLLDKNLKMTGKLTHIAVGESIYAARYLGDMAYFITYRNTDPLFAADLSDEKNPKLVGELKITGFSEYLHFWGEDKLLGLGYETDAKTGEQKGLKLVMFDMTDPAALKILDNKVLEGESYSPALYNYKAVLAAPEENLIGFVTERYNRGVKRTYELYQWNGDSFEKILSEKLDDGFGNENYRGLYIGAQFYIAHPEVVRYYDRADYKLKQKLELSK